MPSPGTLQRMEDPRAWHARGEVGIQHPRRPAGPAGGGAVALPMAPPPPKGRMVPAKKTVLEEEEYVDRLGEIIEGDYFPHNAKMNRTLADLAGNGIGNTPSRTPSASSVVGTPSSVIGMPTPGGSVPRPGGGLGANGGGGSSGLRSSSKEAGTGGALTKFVATHTSEDNKAFAELQVGSAPARASLCVYRCHRSILVDTRCCIVLRVSCPLFHGNPTTYRVLYTKCSVRCAERRRTGTCRHPSWASPAMLSVFLVLL